MPETRPDLNDRQRRLLRALPAVDRLLELAKSEAAFELVPKTVVVNAIRTAIESDRQRIRQGGDPPAEADLADAAVMQRVKALVGAAMRPQLVTVINATGVVIHTNLGRSLLSPPALENMAAIAGCYSNLEYDLHAGQRGSRYMAVRDLLCEITGAEDAMVVNNNAGAVLISLETIARDREVIVSRGDLVEIGGSFRIPDVMAKSGAILKEVGTTNRTHLRDYENAVTPVTALLLKVHWSNYSIVGFTAQVSLKDMVALAARRGIPVMEDLGSGTFIDLSRYGLAKEPTVQESVASGADLVTFSGDKLLGGPQAGIIVGRRGIIASIRKNPINRALRIDKLTLAALESTLRLYRDEAQAVAAIPTLRMLTEREDSIRRRAQQLARRLRAIGDPRLRVDILRQSSKAGGGALPLLELPTRCVRVRVEGLTENQLERRLRLGEPAIIGRIEDGAFLMDARTIQAAELPAVASALKTVLKAP